MCVCMCVHIYIMFIYAFAQPQHGSYPDLFANMRGLETLPEAVQPVHLSARAGSTMARYLLNGLISFQNPPVTCVYIQAGHQIGFVLSLKTPKDSLKCMDMDFGLMQKSHTMSHCFTSIAYSVYMQSQCLLIL